MAQQEPLLILAGIVIFFLSIYALALKIKLWFIGQAIGLLTSWIPRQENTRTFDNDITYQTDVGGAFILFIWIFNIIGLYWILNH